MAKISFIGSGVKRHTELVHSQNNSAFFEDASCLDGIDIDKFYIYGHYKEDTNELFYIGKGKGARAIRIAGRSIHWKNIVLKHGCIIKMLASDLTEEEAFTLEKQLIKQYGRIDNYTGSLINLTDGGEGGSGLVYTQEMLEYRSFIMSGEKNHQFGIHKFGTDNPNYGNKFGDNPLAKPVLSFTLNGEFVKEYQSISETELDGFNGNIVSACCSNKRPSNKNHLFMYKEDFESGKPIPIYKRGQTSKRQVIGFDESNKTYRIYDGAKETSNDEFAPKNVQQCCNKDKKSHRGIIWQYLDEVPSEKLLRYSLAIRESV